MSDAVATRNACKLCMPLGACLVFKGIEGCVPFLHGSQGCSTYIRRYMISHFREPVDIASSNFSEETAVFGGGNNLIQGLKNIISQYHPSLIGVATTCLAETIGDDVAGYLRAFRAENSEAPPVVQVSTPSYASTHAQGYQAAVKAVVEQLVSTEKLSASGSFINIFPNILSPEDLRSIKQLLGDFGLAHVMLPDYSDTLDGQSWDDHQLIPPGGTKVRDIRRMGCARASISFGRISARVKDQTAGNFLQHQHGVAHYALGMPTGFRETDQWMTVLKEISGRPIPETYQKERGRLIDALVDGHKYVFGKKVVVYGEEDLIVGLVSFLSEAGLVPVLCASGGESGFLQDEINRVLTRPLPIKVIEGADFADIEESAQQLKPDIIIGNSKGYKLARQLDIPLVRVGFPVHDRIGAQRILHCGYRGALALYDRIVNALLDQKQEDSDIGYSYL